MTKISKVVCSWCGRVIRENEDKDGEVSHGLCLICAPKMLPGRKENPEEKEASKAD